MTKGQQYRLKIDAYTPETMPLKVMSEYLSDLATLFGEEGCVHLNDVEAGSTCPVVLVDCPRIEGHRIYRAIPI